MTPSSLTQLFLVTVSSHLGTPLSEMMASSLPAHALLSPTRTLETLVSNQSTLIAQSVERLQQLPTKHASQLAMETRLSSIWPFLTPRLVSVVTSLASVSTNTERPSSVTRVPPSSAAVTKEITRTPSAPRPPTKLVQPVVLVPLDRTKPAPRHAQSWSDQQVIPTICGLSTNNLPRTTVPPVLSLLLC